MAQPYTVELPGGGEIVVNANSPEAARENAGVPAGAAVHAGGYQHSGGDTYADNASPQNPHTAGSAKPQGVDPALAAYFEAISGFDYDQLAQNDRQFQASLQLQREQMERIGIPQVEIQKKLAEMEDEHFKQQLGLATRQQTFNEEVGRAGLTGTYNGAPTEQARQFNETNALQQGQLGLNYTAQAAQFAASDPFALSDFMRGAQQRTDVPVFLQNLENGVAASAAGGGMGTPKNATTYADLQAGLVGPQAGVQAQAAQPAPAPTQPAAAPRMYGQYNLDQVAQQVAAMGGNVALFNQIMNDPSHPSSLNWGLQQATGGKIQAVEQLPAPAAPAAPAPAAQPTYGITDPGYGAPAQRGVVARPTPQAPSADPALIHAYGDNVGIFPGEGGSTLTRDQVIAARAANRAPGPSTGGIGPSATSINPQTTPALSAIDSIYRRGADKLAVGSLESLDTNELNTLGQGISHRFGAQAAPAFIEAYKRTRPQQSAASRVAQLA